MNHFAVTNAKTIVEAAAAASATVAEAMAALGGRANGDHISVVKAGGIDLLDLLKENLLAPANVVNLREVPQLDGVVEEADGGIHIGPMVTLAVLAEHQLLRERYPALSEALRESASPQIRNMATIGGNLLQRPRCWYLRSHAFHCLRKGGGHCFAISGENQYHAIFDNALCAIVHPSTAATALVALDATIELGDARRAVRQLPLEQFFITPARDVQRENDLRPREILSAIRLPKLPSSVRMAHIKQGEKDSFDWPLADVAVVLDLAPSGLCNRASIVLGAAAPLPHRAKAAEAVLTGKRVDETTAAQASRAALEGATPLSKNAYKIPLFEALVRRAVLKAAGPA